MKIRVDEVPHDVHRCLFLMTDEQSGIRICKLDHIACDHNDGAPHGGRATCRNLEPDSNITYAHSSYPGYSIY